MNSIASSLLAWLLTYLIHSTVLLGIAWLVTRGKRLEPAASDLIWKVALLAGLVTGTIQSRLELSTPAAVQLPVAQPATPTDPGRQPGVGAPATDPATATQSVPQTPGYRPGSAGSQPSVGPSLPLVLVLLWGFVAFASSLYYVARRLILVGRLADRRAVSDGPLAATLAELRLTTGYRRRVHLTMARTISSPVALGLSEICVPELALSELGMEQQRSMLAHELAHLARRDALWLAGASLIERLFFFQPLNRLARRELETTAEYLSDEWAMRKTGSAVSLAKCLATVAEWIQASPLGVPVAGLAERRSLLVSRISRLLEGRLPKNPASRIGWAALATAGVMVTIAAAPRVSQGVAAVTTTSVDTTRALPEVSSSAVSPKSQVAPAPQDTGVVNALIARLKDDNASVRRAAAQSLGRLGDVRAVPSLIAVLTDSDAEVRATATDALADFEDPRAIDPIVALLKDPVTDVRKNALNALSHWEHGVPAAPVIALMDDPDAEVRHGAVDLLDHLEARSAASAIARLIHDSNADVRGAVVQALGHMNDQGGAAAITEALNDANPDVRHQALDALNDLKAPITEATLLKMMTDVDPDVRQAAAHIAGELSVVAAIPALPAHDRRPQERRARSGDRSPGEHRRPRGAFGAARRIAVARSQGSPRGGRSAGAGAVKRALRVLSIALAAMACSSQTPAYAA